MKHYTSRLRTIRVLLRVSAILGITGGAVLTTPALAQQMEVLDLELPAAIFKGTPPEIELNEHIEPPSDKQRPPVTVPKGTRLLSRGKPVALSDPSPVTGSAALVTDGIKDAYEEDVLEMHRRTQWVQIDLESPAKLYAVVVWHAYGDPQIVRDVIVQVAEDADFTRDVVTLYNNDYDNSSGFGVGKDKEYFESYEGRLIEVAGVTGRYVRLYSRGSTLSGMNRYAEVEVFGVPQ